MSSNNYRDKMRPYAERAASQLGMPVDVILAQWQLESGGGTSDMARRYNNHAGIKYSDHSKVARPRSDSAFAAYRSLDDFTTDYIRVMSLGYYKDVRSAGATGDLEDTVIALGASPYDADHYDNGNGPGSKLAGLVGVQLDDGLTAVQKNEIERKAAAGIALTNPSAAAQAYWESVSGKKYRVCPECHRPL